MADKLEKPKRRKFRQEDVYTAYVHRPLALEIVRLIWNTNITANQITLFRVVLNVIALILFAMGTKIGFIAGFFVFQINEILDSVDGMYARMKKQTSKLGAYFEYLFDGLFSTSFGLFGLAIAFGAYRATGDLVYIWLFILITVAQSMDREFYLLFHKDKICKNENIENIDHDKEEFAQIFGVGLKKGIRNFLYTVAVWKNELLLWGALFFFWAKERGVDLIFWALIIHAILINAFWIKRAYDGYKKAKMMDMKKLK
jgi:phosphatidylglycerophosphate synthase